MKRMLIAIVLLGTPLFAQDAKNDGTLLVAPAKIQKLFILKYADPQSLYDVLRIFGDNSMVPNTQMHALAVTATPRTMQSIEDAIARLDTPAYGTKNIDLTMQLVVGSDSDVASGGPLPKDLEPVVTQLRNAFPFKNYRLLDVLTIRTRERQRASTDSSGGAMQFGNVTKPVNSSFGINGSSIGPDGTTVRLDGLRATTKIPVETGMGQFSYQDLNLSTDVDIKEGQKVVIGRHGINREQALFLVLSAKLVQ